MEGAAASFQITAAQKHGHKRVRVLPKEPRRVVRNCGVGRAASKLPVAPSLRVLGGEKSGDACGAKAKLLHCETAIRFQALNES